MEIEWDNAKRQQTLKERGLDFADVALIDWETALIFDDERQDYGEKRQTAMGYLNGRLVIVAFTVRGETLRVISLRKANRREQRVYDSFE